MNHLPNANETKNDDWNTGDAPNVADDCSYTKAHARTIVLTQEITGVVRKLCDEIKTEWQMLLCGIEDGDTIYVSDYYIPKQEVTFSSVKNVDCIDKELIDSMHIVAGIHSHGTFGVFFSATDDEHTNMSLIKHNIVVNNKGDMKAVSRVELPCGMTMLADATVIIDTPEVTEVKGIDRITKSKEPTYLKGTRKFTKNWRNCHALYPGGDY